MSRSLDSAEPSRLGEALPLVVHATSEMRYGVTNADRSQLKIWMARHRPARAPATAPPRQRKRPILGGGTLETGLLLEDIVASIDVTALATEEMCVLK